ncbi:hypothetical protein V8C40DRAFT_79554 [Trichoderma camerunense]
MAQRNTSNCALLRYYFVPFVFGLLILFSSDRLPLIYRLLKGREKEGRPGRWDSRLRLFNSGLIISMSCVKAGRFNILSFEAILLWTATFDVFFVVLFYFSYIFK